MTRVIGKMSKDQKKLRHYDDSDKIAKLRVLRNLIFVVIYNQKLELEVG